MIEESVYEDGISKAKKSHRLKRRIIILVISLLVIAAVIVGVYIVSNYYKEANTLTYDNYKLYQYFGGRRYDYDGIVTISYKEGVTNVKSDKIDINIDNTPIYFQNINNEVLFPVNMELVFPHIKTRNYRIKHFSKISIDEVDNKEHATLITNDDKKNLEQCFLYDGNDLYFFPYSTTVVLGEEKYELSPLSYVTVDYKGMVEIYDKYTDTFTTIEEFKDDVIAYYNTYKINLSTDMIMYGENDNKLLIKSVDKLNLYGEDANK